MSNVIRDDQRPCPLCGNNGESEETPIYNAVRHYPGIEFQEFPGFAVNDVGWRCGLCDWEYGFEVSEPSYRGDAVTMKPCRVLLEIPREMLAPLRKVWLLWGTPGSQLDVGNILNHLVNCVCEGVNDPESWQRTWLHLAGILVEGEDPEKLDDVSIVEKTALRHTLPPQPKEGGKNDG